MNQISGSVIITGASDGIGREMALLFAKRGFRLGLIARRGELLQVLAVECRALGAPLVETAAVDVTDSPAFRAGLNKLESALGPTDYFIANAGVTGRSSNSQDNWEDVKKTMMVNSLAAMDGLEWMKVRMVKRGSGTLVGVSSVAGTRGLPTSGAYSASKAALTSYLETLRVDLRGTGVHVLTVAPGFIHTAMTAKNKGAMPFVIDVKPAAEIFVRGILAKKIFIVAPWQFRYIILLLTIVPRGLYDLATGSAMKKIR